MTKEKENNKEPLYKSGTKIFIVVPVELGIKIRKFRHEIYADKLNSAVVKLLELGIEKSQEDGMIKKLRKENEKIGFNF